MELERSDNIIIVTHQAVLRCIYAYYMNLPQEQSPWMEVPLHTLIKLTPRAYHTQEERFPANIPAVSTFREKGSEAKHQEGVEGKDAGVGEREREEIERAIAEEKERGDDMDTTPIDTPIDPKSFEDIRPQVRVSFSAGHMEFPCEKGINQETIIEEPKSPLSL